MAAASPILITSSSPASFRMASVEPSNLHDIEACYASPSSPNLLSPGRFARPKAIPTLKSGSRAQPLPPGSNEGFASAANLWRSHYFDDQVENGSQSSKIDIYVTKKRSKPDQNENVQSGSTGKLVRPRKAPKRANTVEATLTNLSDPCAEGWSYPEPAETRRPKAAASALRDGISGEITASSWMRDSIMPKDGQEDRDGHERVQLRDLPSDSIKTDFTANASRTQASEMDLKNFRDFNSSRTSADPDQDAAFPLLAVSDDDPEQESDKLIDYRETSVRSAAIELDQSKTDHNTRIYWDAAKTAKTGAGRATKTGDGKISKPAKQPRKLKKKSESIILNSDEPDSAVEARLAANTPNTDSKDKSAKARKTRPEKIKGSTILCPHQRQDETTNKEHKNDDGTTSSLFFDPTSKARTSTNLVAKDKLPETSAVELTDNAYNEMASRRRRSWTPVQSTGVIGVIGVSDDPSMSTGILASDVSCDSRKQMSEILAHLSYTPDEHTARTSVEQSATIMKATKGRRIELIESGANPAMALKSSDTTVSKPVKRAKSVKKAQTITALATAPYQPRKEQAVDQMLMSSFLTSRTDDTIVSQDSQKAAIAAETKKSRQQHKIRANSANANAGLSEKRQTGKVKKSAVKVTEIDEETRLYSPTRATARLSAQDFLFGTSSQLAVDESPVFIREMQLAVNDSETTAYGIGLTSSPPQPSHTVAIPSRGKSCVRVPTAPHGTSLSINQADGELWCVAARDRKGGLFRHKTLSALRSRMEEETRRYQSDALEIREYPSPAQPDAREDALILDKSSLAGKAQEDAPKEHASLEGDFVHLCQSSPPPQVSDSDEDEPICETSNDEANNSQRAGDPCLTPDPEEDTLMLLQSGESELVTDEPILVDVPTEHVHSVSCSSCRPLLSAALGSCRTRSPLRTLDKNTTILPHVVTDLTGALEQRRPLSSTASPAARAKAAVKHSQSKPKRDAGSASAANNASSRGSGRPPKKSDSKTQLPLPPKSKDVVIESTVSRPDNASSRWLDIDEISDSDPEKTVTPSPPRRRYTGSPSSTVQPLTLEAIKAPESASVGCDAGIPTLSVHNAGDSQWTAVLQELYPRITAAIKLDPTVDAVGELSWWDRILFYDPIVVEELAAWLNAQGLRIKVRRKKPKAKKRGRKRGGVGDADKEAEFEIVEEKLLPWMVQKWCEVSSVCCISKENGRHRISGARHD